MPISTDADVEDASVRMDFDFYFISVYTDRWAVKCSHFTFNFFLCILILIYKSFIFYALNTLATSAL